ncbi:MAG TPA: hypothetical protein VD908_07245 [Cytophagales bacterium]|nr:hypothetical protein [Cytophagales bacterium]
MHLSSKTSWMTWSVLFILFLFMGGYVMPHAAESIMNIAKDASCFAPLDIQMGVSLEDAHKSLDCSGPEGRELYRTIEKREDVFYPIIAGLLFSFTLYSLSFFCYKKQKLSLSLALVPFIITLADLTENYFVINLIDQFPSLNPETVKAMSSVNKVKWVFLFMTLGFVAYFSVVSLIRIFNKRNRQ